ncbi:MULTISPECIES: dynamin family protein [unclassified Coleofasciculus]|uniref:dynamin family protein n=1 Tax=unclassified Coleofasciculus TaxID=2692782 RepID=UPI00188258DA|nr:MULTISPECIES: dynamin family protein [unclassified Coleofasciculus]MBE9124876.1 dynamin family protein [Coleofasciculus sp. LEGE 07081]MBE9147880.1 dynamin family protein [Coleofasciculus sp. LEGE 07092]
MEQQAVFRNLANSLRSIIGLLDIEQNSQLRQDAIAICDYLENPIFRIAVFGPFNYGKSTLLNALLGKRTLPIDLIPTTGAAIHLGYGEELHTRITLTDGRDISESGTDILKQFAILDDQRRMRDDVARVEVFCAHPFLQTGVELLDLPGTDDREAQDVLVRDQLLTVDLIVQVLDARKLMTLGERENLRDWLIDRGIKTIVFVVNFLNLLEPEDQKQVYNRMLFVAESFRSELPNNISNIYRVDALPALRARLKGDTAAAQTTGLATFESALQSIAATKHENLGIRFPRVEAIANRVKQASEAKVQTLTAELATAEQKNKAKLEIKQKAQKLIQKGFSASISDFQGWLYLPKLLDQYKSELALALQNGTFSFWEQGAFKEAIAKYQDDIIKWVHQGCEFFDCASPVDLSISFPSAPEVILPEPPPQSSRAKDSGGVTPVAIATGLGWMFGGPMGAAVAGGATYLFNKNPSNLEPQNSSTSYLEQVTQVYAEAAENYLTRFSMEAFTALQHYEQLAAQIMTINLTEKPVKRTAQHHQLQLLETLLENLSQELEALKESF